MSIIFALKCDRCEDIESLEGVATYQKARGYQVNWNDYNHVCDDCLAELEEESADEVAA